MRIVLLGPPGVGKGTHGRLLAEHLQAAHISTGELLRLIAASGSPLGEQIAQKIDRGMLVADEMMVDLVRTRLGEPDVADGFVLDGFPRTLSQASWLATMLREQSEVLDAVILITIDQEEIERRIRDRAGKEDRPDDTPETVRQRLQVYFENTAPLIEYYQQRDLLLRVQSRGTVEEVQTTIRRELFSP